MIIPTTTDLLACIEGNLERKVEPALNDPIALSAIATIKHLLRYLAERIRDEGQALSDEIVALRALLPELAQRFRHTDLGASIDAALKPENVKAGQYRNLESLAAEARRLREALHTAVAAVHADSSSPEKDQAIRTKIRSYIMSEILDETKMVEAAFVGRGPRR